MSSTRLHNRQAFLANLTTKLGRAPLTAPTSFSLNKQRQHEIFAEDTEEERLAYFLQYAQSKLGVKTYRSTQEEASQSLLEDCQYRFGNAPGKVLISDDPRLRAITENTNFAQSGFETHVWNSDLPRSEQVKLAEQAQVGIVFAERALIESGTIMLESSALQGRSISLLPLHSIFVIRKSTLLPRATQACELLHQRVQSGERLPSCVNFISGPSSTADIELIKVVGVHGPISATYVILEDA